MTFILGARCADGVVLIGDTLILGSKDSSFGHKIFSPFPGAVIAVDGLGIFELLKYNILDFVESKGLINNPVSIERSLNRCLKYLERLVTNKAGILIHC